MNIGSTIKEIGYLWNYFLSEFSYYHRLKKPLNGPDIFSIEMTSKCNLRCIMCPHPTLVREKSNMNLETYKKIVDNIAPHAHFVWVHGLGESLLHPNFDDMIKYAKDKGLKIGISTNATILTESIGRRLIESGVDKIIMSMESIEKETYEKIRVGGKFEVVKSNVKRFLELKKEMGRKAPYTIVQVIQMKETAPQIEAFKKEWKPICDEVVVKVFSTWANQVDTIPVLAEREQRYHKQLKKRHPCQLLWKNMVILADGTVSPCCIDYEGKIKLGNAAEQPLEEVWRGEPMQKLRELHLNGDYQIAPVCDGCEEWLGGPKISLYPLDEKFLEKVKRLIQKYREENLAF